MEDFSLEAAVVVVAAVEAVTVTVAVRVVLVMTRVAGPRRTVVLMMPRFDGSHTMTIGLETSLFITRTLSTRRTP